MWVLKKYLASSADSKQKKNVSFALSSSTDINKTPAVH